MVAFRPWRGAARSRRVSQSCRGRGPKSVKDTRKAGKERDRIHRKASPQEHAGGGFCEAYLGSMGRMGDLCMELGTGEYYFLVPVTEGLAAVAAARKSTCLHFSGVRLELDLFHKGAVEFFATLVKIPAAGLQNIEVNAKHRMFQLGTSATETSEAARPRTKDDPTVERIVEHAYDGFAADGTLFDAPMKPGLPPGVDASVNKGGKIKNHGRFSISLDGRGDGSDSALTSYAPKDSICVYWEPKEDLTVCDGLGNVVVGDRYVILVGVRPRGVGLVNDGGPSRCCVAYTKGVAAEYYGHF